MPIEGVVNRIKDLDSRWPRNADIVREGAQHLRNIKLALRQFDTDETGTIKLFWGAVTAIPPGWVVCDGQNGTPNLQNRVPVGAGGQYALGAIGGADTVTLTTNQMPPHGHTGTAQDGGDHVHTATSSNAGYHAHGATSGNAGNHRHVMQSWRIENANRKTDQYGSETSYGPYEGSTYPSYTTYDGVHNHPITVNGDGTHNHPITINSGGKHGHTVTVGNTGGGASHENRMPYLALHFIMKLAS